MAFVEGQFYTREKISSELGGSPVWYLPVHMGKVVCACLTDFNVNRPEEILVGKGREIQHSASILEAQGGSIPVFLKQDTNNWEYVGMYQMVGKINHDRTLLDERNKFNLDETVTGVITMKKVEL